MARQFTLTRAQVMAADPDSLRAEIVTAAGSEAGAESILRSLERLGTDASIEHYEMTHVTARRMQGGAPDPGSWRVRAERAVEDVEAAADGGIAG